ncbi:MAG TPA: DedA family protein [Candidatus Nitrosocosmicus sp.]|nr:DedA family protein [Candidatus Nitrosocosmicus sp.]
MPFTKQMVDVVESIISLISSFSYLGIFVAAFVETIFPPIPSEIICALAGFVSYKSNYSYCQILLMAFSGALGSTVGAVLIYFLSYRFGRVAILKIGKYLLVNENKVKKSEDWFEHYGVYAVFLGRLAPGIREIISIPAGIAKMNFTNFFIFTFAGSLVWSTLLVFLGYAFGNSWVTLSNTLSDFFPIFFAVLILCIGIVAMIYLIKRKRTR